MINGGKATDDDTDRPLTARSVLASTLLGSEPPELPVARLVAVTRLFGLSENATRVALSRMVASGELASDTGSYRLAGHLLHRHARQHRSRAADQRSWDGSWLLVVITAERRSAAERQRARADLGRARLAEVREGVWCRPANVDIVVPDTIATVAEQFRVEPADPVPLAARLWDLEDWAERARRLHARLEATAGDLDPGSVAALAPGFVLSASVLRHFQADPLLPPALLPPDWPGPLLRRTYDEWDRAYRGLLRRYHAEVAVSRER